MPYVYPISAPEPRAALGWDGTDFHVLACDTLGNLRLAPGGVNLRQYAGIWRVKVTVSGGAGALSASSPALTSGQLVYVQHALARLSAGTATGLCLRTYDLVVTRELVRKWTPDLVSELLLPNPVLLVEDDMLQAIAEGVGVGTTLSLLATGYYVQT